MTQQLHQPTSVRGRADDRGAAFASSQLQTQLRVNRRPLQLSEFVGAALAGLEGAGIEWVSPLGDDRFREYQDAGFLGRLGFEQHAGELAEFWPARGPVWDALAVVDLGGRRGVILGEDKSYPDELHGSGCQAGAASRTTIERALEQTQAWLGLEPDPARWCGRLYQSANRLAHLYWLNQVVGVPTWLVHLLFTNDPHRPTTEHQWKNAMREADAELGLTEPVAQAGHVLLAAGSLEDLVPVH